MGLPSPPLGLRFGVGAGLGLGLPNPNPNPKPALTPNLRPKGGEGRHIPRNLDWSFSSVFLFLHQSWQSRCGVGGEARFQPTLSPPDLTHPLTVVNRIVVDEVFWIYCLRKKESKITVSTHVMCVCVCGGGGGGGRPGRRAPEAPVARGVACSPRNFWNLEALKCHFKFLPDPGDGFSKVIIRLHT